MANSKNLLDVTPGSATPPSARSNQAGIDASLVAALVRGDEAAFVGLVERYHSALMRVAMLYVHDGGTAEEVVQDTWIAVLQGIRSFEGRSSLKTWIFHILLNRARRRGQRESRLVPFSALALEEAERTDPAVDPDRFRPPNAPEWPGNWSTPPRSWETNPEESALSAEIRRYLSEAIDVLPEAQRTVISLRDLEGFSALEACNILGISETNQRVLLHRARSKVRGALDTYLVGKAQERRSQ